MKKLSQLIDLAIEDEKSSQKFYLQGKEKTGDAKIREMLQRLADDEKRHASILIGIKEMEIYDGDTEVEDEIFMTTIDSHRMPDEKISAELTIEEVLQIAMQKETKAFRIYGHIAATAEHDEIKKLFKNMADEERIHHDDIEKKFRAITGTMGDES